MILLTVVLEVGKGGEGLGDEHGQFQEQLVTSGQI